MLPLIGRLVDPQCTLSRLMGDPRSVSLLAAVAAIFTAYANFVVAGYFKDISADRATGYHTLPVVFGKPVAALVSHALAAAAALLTVVAVLLSGRAGPLGVVVLGGGIALSLRAQVGIHRVEEEQRAHGPIAHVVRTFLLYCAAIALTMKPQWWPLAAGFCVLFELTLKRRPETSQV
jgi:1,4-dihydroxy-2-naphthoate octaprenyltransferase